MQLTCCILPAGNSLARKALPPLPSPCCHSALHRRLFLCQRPSSLVIRPRRHLMTAQCRRSTVNVKTLPQHLSLTSLMMMTLPSQPPPHLPPQLAPYLFPYLAPYLAPQPPLHLGHMPAVIAMALATAAQGMLPTALIATAAQGMSPTAPVIPKAPLDQGVTSAFLRASLQRCVLA